MNKKSPQSKNKDSAGDTITRIGCHMSINQFAALPKYAQLIGCKIFQIFLSIPQHTLSKKRQVTELETFGKELVDRDLIVVIHGSYTINLCHPDDSTRSRASIRSLVQDLKSTSIIGSHCLGVIIHMGKNIAANNLPVENAINNYVASLIKALDATPENTTIILETGASQGTEVASKLDGLAEIYWKVPDRYRQRVKICVDTCHIWATGYNISNETGVAKFFQEFDDKIGIKNIVCIHFNDSKTELESCVDRHADLGYGKIGSNGLRAIAVIANLHKIPLITETPLNSINPTTNQSITFREELGKIQEWLDL